MRRLATLRLGPSGKRVDWCCQTWISRIVSGTALAGDCLGAAAHHGTAVWKVCTLELCRALMRTLRNVGGSFRQHYRLQRSHAKVKLGKESLRNTCTNAGVPTIVGPRSGKVEPHLCLREKLTTITFIVDNMKA